MAMFRKLDNRTIISYKVITLSDLHIGGHMTIEPAEVDNPVIKNPDGMPIILGSSLKGVFRTEMEILLRGAKKDVCDIFDPTSRSGCNKCLVCLLFGGKDVTASICIKDATANSKKTLIRNSVAIDRKTRKGRDGGKFDIEVVPKGMTFSGTMTIENTKLGKYKNAKLGALLSLIRFFNSCSGCIGHAVSRGFGEVEVGVETINVLTAQDYLDGNYGGTSYVTGTSEYETLEADSILHWSEYMKA